MLGDVLNKVIFEVAVYMLTNFEGLHEIILLVERDWLAQILFADQRAVGIWESVKPLDFVAELAETDKILASPAAQIEN